MKTIIWDVDGTLIDSEAGIVEALEFAANELKLTSENEIIFRDFIGLTPQNAYMKFFGVSPEKAQEATNHFRNHYHNNGMKKATVFQGIIEVLEEFQKRGYKQAVATNKKKELAIEVCEFFGIAKYFDVIHGLDENGTLCKGDLIGFCLKDLGVTDKSTALMIGDTYLDEEGAQQNDVPFMPVHYGIGNLESAQRIEKPLDIIKYV